LIWPRELASNISFFSSVLNCFLLLFISYSFCVYYLILHGLQVFESREGSLAWIQFVCLSPPLKTEKKERKEKKKKTVT
ncbi:hypothetical protein ACQP3C_29310, partial [Escherichia coli]